MNFALITEGVSDRPLLLTIISCFFSKYYPDIDPNINFLQPKNNDPGGWTLVLNYCSSKEFEDAFAFNDFIVIQIDTDRHQDQGFDIKDAVSTEDLIEKVKAKIICKIGEKVYEKYQKRIIFAIAVHSIECWLLPFYATTNAHKGKEINCCETINKYLKKEGFTIDCNKGENSYNYFYRASALLAKPKILFSPDYAANKSLRYFIEKELSKIPEYYKDLQADAS
jgi:hypothetical protein